MKIHSIFRKGLSARIGWIIMGLLIAISVLHYSMYNYQNEIMHSRIEQTNQEFKNATWNDIEGVLETCTVEAGLEAQAAADDIIKNIDIAYPDNKELLAEFDNGNYTSPKFLGLLMDTIKDRYLLDIRTRNNDIFIICRYGILVDMNVENFNKVYRPIKEEASSHYNPDLAFTSLENILRKNTVGLTYYETRDPGVDPHMIITSPTKEQLKEVYMKEGFEGLKGYTILVPAYITDDGDIFGTPDISSDGSVNMTHKLIIVQRFSIYDVIKYRFYTQEEQRRNLHNRVDHTLVEVKNFYAFAFAVTIILDIVVMLFFLKYATKVNRKDLED